MIRKFITAIMAAFCCVLAANADEVEKYVLNVGDFTELQIIDNLSVIHRCDADSAGLAVFSCPKNMASAMMFSNKKNKLKIEWNLEPETPVTDLPVITVYSNFIQSVENCGDSTVTVFSPAPGALFKAKVIGNGKIIVDNIHATQTEANLETGKGNIIMNGATRVAKFKNIGTGTINASDLTAETVSIIILGTGPVMCNASGTVTVKGMGSGKVYLTGDATVKKRSLGSINVIRTEETKE